MKNGSSKGKQKYVCRHCAANDGRPHHFEEGAKVTTPEIKAVGLSEAQLRAKYDLRFIVETKCRELKEGNFLSRSEFIQFCGIRPGGGYLGVLEHPDYEKYHGKAGGTIYWSHPASIKKLKDEGVLL